MVVQAHFEISQPFHSTYLACFKVGCLCASLERQILIILFFWPKHKILITQNICVTSCTVYSFYIFFYIQKH